MEKFKSCNHSLELSLTCNVSDTETRTTQEKTLGMSTDLERHEEIRHEEILGTGVAMMNDKGGWRWMYNSFKIDGRGFHRHRWRRRKGLGCITDVIDMGVTSSSDEDGALFQGWSSR